MSFRNFWSWQYQPLPSLPIGWNLVQSRYTVSDPGSVYFGDIGTITKFLTTTIIISLRLLTEIIVWTSFSHMFISYHKLLTRNQASLRQSSAHLRSHSSRILCSADHSCEFLINADLRRSKHSKTWGRSWQHQGEYGNCGIQHNPIFSSKPRRKFDQRHIFLYNLVDSQKPMTVWRFFFYPLIGGKSSRD